MSDNNDTKEFARYYPNLSPPKRKNAPETRQETTAEEADNTGSPD